MGTVERWSGVVGGGTLRRSRRVVQRWCGYGRAGLMAAVVVGIAGLSIRAGARDSRRVWCSRNLSALGLAFHAYHEANGHFPAAAVVGMRGEPLLSWRVELLPYLGRRDLYERFRRDEPWDSPHNVGLLAEMPDVYACPSERGARRGLTRYQGIVGPRPGLGVIGTLFEPARGIDIREVTDGPSQTVQVAEALRLVPWTRPEDLRLEQGGPLPRFGSRHRDGANMLLGDGSARLMRFTIAPNALRAILTRDGGEVVGGD
jgi:prepilin-type processing-associated H-X9-DG protein